MSFIPFKQWFYVGAVCAGSVLLTTGCVDSDYDLDNIDLTMGLGSEGLSVKLGNTEKVYLNNIIDVDETVKLDNSNFYYLVEDGETDFNVSVENVNAKFENTNIRTNQPVLTFDGVLEQMDQSQIPASITEVLVGANQVFGGKAEGSANADFNVKVQSDIVSVSEVITEETPIVFKMNMENSPNMRVKIDHLANFVIQLPKFITVKEVSNEWNYNSTNNTLSLKNGRLDYSNAEICRLVVNKAVFGEAGVVENGKISLPDVMTATSVDGEVFFRTTENFTMHKDLGNGQGDYANVVFDLQLGLGTDVRVEQAIGVFNPEINPEIKPINIKESLPDFLTDEAVRVNAANPTIKFMADLTQIPVGINFGAQLTSVKAGDQTFPKSVVLPQISIDEKKLSTVYYHQKNEAYDPDGVVKDAKHQQVDNITKLFETLPDEIQVNMKEGRIAVQDKPYTVNLGQTYNAKAKYNVFVPFEFNNGFVIVYNDSTDSMKDDLEDYAAEGVRVTADVNNTIPLDLVATITAVDVDGNPVPGVTFDKANIPASTDGKAEAKTSLQIDATLSDPYLLRKIDRFMFNINAASGESTETHKLYSTQYLEFTNVKVRLKGQIIADFN